MARAAWAAEMTQRTQLVAGPSLPVLSHFPDSGLCHPGSWGKVESESLNQRGDVGVGAGGGVKARKYQRLRASAGPVPGVLILETQALGFPSSPRSACSFISSPDLGSCLPPAPPSQPLAYLLHKLTKIVGKKIYILVYAFNNSFGAGDGTQNFLNAHPVLRL